MFIATRPLILASASPRRKALLSQLGCPFTVQPAAIDERPLVGEIPHAYAKRLAHDKAELVACSHPDCLVLGADTVVVFNGEILGKPKDATQALDFLRLLNGARHAVITGYAAICKQEAFAAVEHCQSWVQFGAIDDALLSAYAASGDPLDKAGAYGLQGRGAFLVEAIQGSCTNVMGLPMHTVLRLLLRSQLFQLKDSIH